MAGATVLHERSAPPVRQQLLVAPREFFSLRQKWADQQEERVERGIFFNKYGELIDQAVSAVMDQVAYKLVYGTSDRDRHDSSGGGRD